MTNAKSTLRIMIPALLLVLAGCTTPFKANVARFQQLPPAQGQSFTVVPADPTLVGSIEFRQYASLVTQALQQQGYAPANDPAGADLVVSFDYIVDGGRERVRTTPGFGPGFGAFGGGFGGFGFGRFNRFGWGGFGGPWGGFGPWGFGGFGPDVRSYTIYNSELDMKIDRVADNLRVFEGRAQATSRTNNLTYLVPNLVEAMFAEFPGNSGETVRVSLDDDKVKVRSLNRRR
ncbi:MAG: DUF4136 domain-containing protein [Pseudomonadota bacterium]